MIKITKKQLEWMTNYAFDNFTDVAVMAYSTNKDNILGVYDEKQKKVFEVTKEGKLSRTVTVGGNSKVIR